MHKSSIYLSFMLTLLLATPPLVANTTPPSTRCENHDVLDDEACEPSWWESFYENAEYVLTHPLTIGITIGSIMWYLLRTRSNESTNSTTPLPRNPDTPTDPKKDPVVNLEKDMTNNSKPLSEQISSEKEPSGQVLFEHILPERTADVHISDNTKPEENTKRGQRSDSTPSSPEYPVLGENRDTSQASGAPKVSEERAFAKGITAALRNNRLFAKASVTHAQEDATTEQPTKQPEGSTLLASAKRVGGAKGRRLPGNAAAKNK